MARVKVLAILMLSGILLGLCGPRLASAAEIPEIVWKSSVGEQVVLETEDGLELRGLLKAYDKSTLVIVKADGALITLATSRVAKVSMAQAPPVVSNSAPIATPSQQPLESQGTRARSLSAEKEEKKEKKIPTVDGAWTDAAMTKWLTKWGPHFSSDERSQIVRLNQSARHHKAVSGGFWDLAAVGFGGEIFSGIFTVVFLVAWAEESDPTDASEYLTAAGGFGVAATLFTIPLVTGLVGHDVHRGVFNRKSWEVQEMTTGRRVGAIPNRHQILAMLKPVSGGVHLGPSGGGFRLVWQLR